MSTIPNKYGILGGAYRHPNYFAGVTGNYFPTTFVESHATVEIGMRLARRVSPLLRLAESGSVVRKRA